MKLYFEFEVIGTRALNTKKVTKCISLEQSSNIEQYIHAQLIDDTYKVHPIRYYLLEGLCILDCHFDTSKQVVTKVRVEGKQCYLIAFTMETTSPTTHGIHKITALRQSTELYLIQRQNKANKFLIFLTEEAYLKLTRNTQSLIALVTNTQNNKNNTEQQYPISFNMADLIAKIRNCSRTGSLHEYCLQIKLMELLLLQIEQLTTFHSTEKKEGLNSHDIKQIQLVPNILENNFLDPPTIIELSKMIGINENKLKKGFKQIFDSTIHSYLTKYRMNMAYQMLKSNDHSIGDVAQLVGYSNISHFSTTFKKHFGYLPSKLMP